MEVKPDIKSESEAPAVSSAPRSPRIHGRYKGPTGDFCCVPGCTNSRGKCNRMGKQVSFYTFPRDSKRLKMWLDRIRLDVLSEDGHLVPFTPKNHHRVCSEHFVGGKKVDHPNSEAYVPSEFPRNAVRKRTTKRSLEAGLAVQVVTKKQKKATAELAPKGRPPFSVKYRFPLPFLGPVPIVYSAPTDHTYINLPSVMSQGVVMETCTCTAPVNMAVIKYWGKRHKDLVLPLNSSISATLDQKQLRTKTTVAISPSFEDDRLWLNGIEERVDTVRIQNLLAELRQRSIEQQSCPQEWFSWKLHVCSENNFPTAAGLASSAAGYACLAFSLAVLYRLRGDISDIARRGSGSACRSMYGGFVIWDKGTKADGTDSIARQLYPETHWPELHILILVVSDQKKHTCSTAGMEVTVETSSLMKQRIRLVPDRIKEMTSAIEKRDFHKFAELTMKDSNQLHAVCLDSYPPISYMTDVSRQIVHMVHEYNKLKGQNKVAYTFDAGPNACLYLIEEDVAEVVSLVTHFFPPIGPTEEFYTGLPTGSVALDQVIASQINLPKQPGAIKYVIHTKPGPGPCVLTKKVDSLLDISGHPKYDTRGEPKSVTTDQ
ncbi:diphosphomevalonate decarboxylase-like isoform X2 [Dreissena polymorpha]|uniref:diphosphomevalonate decarboxylase-like isoform X2 n=1 Tax=Dreissena polymorpha TaxID=45954 RepID=UPI002263B1FF|nr:diphosphomevalonate decarboxylase-like isoform X2 [Dreissena polymorpha]